MTIRDQADKWLKRRYGVMAAAQRFGVNVLRYVFEAGFRAGLKQGRKEK